MADIPRPSSQRGLRAKESLIGTQYSIWVQAHIYAYMTYPARYGTRSPSSGTQQHGRRTCRSIRKDCRVNGDVTLQDTGEGATLPRRRRSEVLRSWRELHRAQYDVRTQVRVTSVVPSKNCAGTTKHEPSRSVQERPN